MDIRALSDALVGIRSDDQHPILPLRPGLPERATHDYVRHGTTTLFAALEVATGRVEQACLPRHRHQEFLRFLKQVAKAHPRVRLHVVCDNYATHEHPAMKAWLARHPRITLHFTPTSGSWLNMVVRHEAAREQRHSSKEDRLMSMV
jgi:transposase